jgi:hypothetical protein
MVRTAARARAAGAGALSAGVLAALEALGLGFAGARAAAKTTSFNLRHTPKDSERRIILPPIDAGTRL